MGAKQSKLVINGAQQETGATHDETPGTCKELNENGTVEAVAAGDTAPHQETANAACEGDASAVAPADQSAAATVNGEEAKPHKKKNPINWIQKKISMKKPRKAETAATAAEPENEQKTKTPAAEGEEAKTAAEVPAVEQAPAPETHEGEMQQPPVEETAVESKWINAPANEACTEISTQAEPIVTKDQAAGFGEESNGGFEQMVEITPTTNGHHYHLMGPDQLAFAEPTHQKFEEPAEPATEGLLADTGISEKLASLGMDVAPEQALTNGHEVATNGHCVVSTDEQTAEN